MSHSKNVAGLYDISTAYWLKMCGAQMHHGYYEVPSSSHLKTPRTKENNSKVPPKENRLQVAQTKYLEELLLFANVDHVDHLLDIGCGTGASMRYLHAKFNAKATGVNVSEIQVLLANAIHEGREVDNLLTVHLQDAETFPFGENIFDLIWSIECLEHIEDKAAIIKKSQRALTVNGKMVVAGWTISKSFDQMNNFQRKLLTRFYHIWKIPALNSAEKYVKILNENNFLEIQSKDITKHIVPFWRDLFRMSLKMKSIRQMHLIHRKMIPAFWGVVLMYLAYRLGVLKYHFIVGSKK